MLLDPRAPLIIGSVLIFMLGGLLAMYSPMPGDLSSPHAKISGMSTIDSCQRCHAGTGTSAGCLGCHKEIDAQMRERRGYHHYLLGGRNVDCGHCHAEHMGSAFSLVSESSWGAQVFRAFRHPHIEFSLKGKHDGLLCEACHQKNLAEPFALEEFPSFTRERTFLGLLQECAACHEDIHANGLSGECDSCHGQEAFRPPELFDHAVHFPLDGGHAQARCAGCHIIPHPETPAQPRPFPFDQVHGTTCTECHESPHRILAGRCDGCHPRPEPLWSGAIDSITPDIHMLTGFRLTGPHAEVSCHRCHPRELPFLERYRNPSAADYLRREDTCEGCHGDVHHGQFEGKYRGCLDCHDRHRFVPANFSHNAHARVYPLTGAHEAVACTSCHVVDTDIHVRKFVGTSTGCKACHENTHGNQFLETISSRDCDACHRRGSDSFKIRPFDHLGRTGYPLEGAHANADCHACHVEVLGSFGGIIADTRRYEGTPNRCVDCHKDVHRGQFQQYGQENCSACHISASSWKSIRFDHNRQSRFPLRGTHARIACSRCHRPMKLDDGSEVVQYKPLGRECGDCHDIGPRSSRRRTR